MDVARVTLVGRLGADPVVRTSEKTGVQYVVYPIATSTGPLGPADADGSEFESTVLLLNLRDRVVVVGWAGWRADGMVLSSVLYHLLSPFLPTPA